MPQFNLVDEPWIPCRLGNTVHDLSLREVFRRTHDIDEVVDPSPLVTASLHRLLLAIVHRVYGPASRSDWQEMWRNGWEAHLASSYLDRWSLRFDLFDQDRPFYQHPTIQGSPWEIANLPLEDSSSNARQFRAPVASLSPAAAARALIAYQAYARPGIVGFQSGEGPAYRSARSGPLAGTAMCLLTGTSLRHTLLLNAVRYNPALGMPFSNPSPELPEDLPTWEQPGPVAVVERLPTGVLDWLTWQSRRIRLIPSMDGDDLSVKEVLVMKGTQLPPGTLEHEFEQLVAYRKNEKAKPPQSPWPPVGFHRDRAIWRDSATLFNGVDETHGSAARNVRDVALRLQSQHVTPMDIYGAEFDQANVLFWRRERLPLTPAYLQEKLLYDRLTQALDLADDMARVLGHATRVLSEKLLGPDRSPDPKAVSALVDNLSPGRRYWSQLEPAFSRFLLSQPNERVPDDGTYGTLALTAWAGDVDRAARFAFRDIARAVGTSARALRAVVEGEHALGGGIARIRKTFPVPPPQEDAHAATTVA